MYLRLRRRRRSFSIRPVPIRCRNRVTYPSRRQHQAPLQDMSLPRQRMSAYRVRPLALTEGHRPQKRVRSTAGPAPSSFVRRRLLIPTITRLSDMATVARGCGMGRLLVPNLALFVTEKLPHQKARTTSQPRQSSVLLSDDRAVQGFTSDLSSCSIKLHDFASAFALTIQVRFVNDIQFETPFIPRGVIELEL